MLLGNGDGSFQAPIDSDFGTNTLWIQADDFNGDGVLDIISLEYGTAGTGTAYVLLGNGDGSFQAPIASQFIDDGNRDMVVADFNEDGNKDVVVGYFSGTSQEKVTLVLLVGNGDGGFQPLSILYTDNSSGPPSLKVADFNGDTHQDIVASFGYHTHDAIVMMSNGDGSFQPAVHYDTMGSADAGVTVGDFNNDRNLDFSVTHSNCCDPHEPNQIGVQRVFLGNGDGSFQSSILGSHEFHGPASIATFDFDGDGILDIVSTTPVAVFRRQGDGTFKLVQRYFAGTNPGHVAVADFNGDSLPDVAVANSTSGTVGLLFNLGGGFDGPAAYSTSAYPSFGATSIAVGDFNNDGLDDLAKTNVTGTLSVVLAVGDGMMGSLDDYPIGADTLDVVTGDLDGDGILDLAASSSGDGTVTLLIGNGDGSFLAGGTIAVGGSPMSIASGFFDPCSTSVIASPQLTASC